MITDLLSIPDGNVFDADVCIVGGGAAGLTIALELEGSGLRVCLLEGGGLIEDPESQAIYAGETTGFPMEMDIGRYRCLGGSTSRWTGRCAPLSPVDFAERSWVPGSGWPIDLDDLAPFYRRAWAICAVRDVVRPDDEVLDELGASRFDIDETTLERFIWRFPSRKDRPRMHFGNSFVQELRQSRTTQVLLHANMCGFEAAGQGESIDAVIVKTLSGITARVRAKAFILAGGGLENARMLLNSAEEGSDNGRVSRIANQHDLVGRYFMQHLRGDTAVIEASAEQTVRVQDVFNVFTSWVGTQYELGFAIPEQVQRAAKLLNASAVLHYHTPDGSSWDAGKSILRDIQSRKVGRQTATAFATMARNPGALVETAAGLWRRKVLARPARLASSIVRVNVELEQLPDPDSRVTLTDERDGLGQRRLRVDWRVSPLEGRTARSITEAVGAEMLRLGVGKIRLDADLLEDESALNLMTRTHHHMGTTRMAADPRRGVVDADCRVHGLANLFVAGSSVFPTGGHANPTLTIVALAARLAAHLRIKFSFSELDRVETGRSTTHSPEPVSVPS